MSITRAQEALRALVCGIPEPRRSRIRLMALRAFVDESGDDRVFVLGGWLSTIAKWEAFSGDWQKCLDLRPKIRVLKMKEAMKCRGAFNNWSPIDRDNRLRLFSEIIYSHAELGMFYRVPYAELGALHAEYRNPEKRFNSIYFWSFYGLLSLFMDNQEQLKINEPVSFVFDKNVIEMDAVYAAWRLFSSEWKKRGMLIGSTPIFENDEIVLPLQASELIAWQTRVTWDESGAQSYPFEGTSWRMPRLWGADFSYNDEMKRFVKSLAK